MKLSESVGWSVLRVNVMRHAEYNLSIYNDKIYSKIMRVCTRERSREVHAESETRPVSLSLSGPRSYMHVVIYTWHLT